MTIVIYGLLVTMFVILALEQYMTAPIRRNLRAKEKYLKVNKEMSYQAYATNVITTHVDKTQSRTRIIWQTVSIMAVLLVITLNVGHPWHIIAGILTAIWLYKTLQKIMVRQNVAIDILLEHSEGIYLEITQLNAELLKKKAKWDNVFISMLSLFIVVFAIGLS
ncbi:hypothetical protein OIT44_00610 [Weissella ceti]|uniref:Uncharacterized protein n=1 Tax=Weissella ceti TaxID=759620 RepID=A0ABT3E2E6_9LACO|nr:hypothetical protein [Weissella ceti]MCW0952596.1 hypothetical protein [Weissella ceti]QVK11741.1 hypothetical protein KHQ31_05870 [Weissella ceti]